MWSVVAELSSAVDAEVQDVPEVFPRPFRNAETARDEPYGPWGA